MSTKEGFSYKSWSEVEGREVGIYAGFQDGCFAKRGVQTDILFQKVVVMKKKLTSQSNKTKTKHIMTRGRWSSSKCACFIRA